MGIFRLHEPLGCGFVSQSFTILKEGSRWLVSFFADAEPVGVQQSRVSVGIDGGRKLNLTHILHHSQEREIRPLPQEMNFRSCLIRVGKKSVENPEALWILVSMTESIQDTSPRIHPSRNKKPVSEKLAPLIYPWGQCFNLKSKI